MASQYAALFNRGLFWYNLVKKGRKLMIKTPVRGMRDLTPSQMILRDYILHLITEEATLAGYQKIETPAMEPLENLTSKEGGENESLIFKVLKRGQSLVSAQEKGEELADSGLRYDLTVPLARYFVNNQKDLPLPFKSLQIGSVWRADRPQKGRFRQFLQCDMDILGEGSVLAEIDTITTTAKILTRIFREAKIEGLTIHLNDRRILTAAVAYAGFEEGDCGSVLISLDKNDKIGFAGVKNDLLQSGYEAEKVEKFISLFEQAAEGIDVRAFCGILGDYAPDGGAIRDLERISSVASCSLGLSGKIVFDPTLVRGMGYYTGPIFECTAGGFSSSVAGGGRYDKMIGKISGGNNVPACGFSIGFERIVAILEDAQFRPSEAVVRRAILVDKKLVSEKLEEVLKRADELRAIGEIVSVVTMSRNLKYQIETMEKNGYTAFEKVYSD